jgi:Zn-dependent peptidase ImmA (M78 family)
MSMAKLIEIRVDLGFTASEVEGAAGWPSGRLAQLERAQDVTDDDADVLTRLYGVDVEALLSGEEGEVVRQPLAALLRGPAEALAAIYRFEIAEVATVAREHRQLLVALGRRDLWPVIQSFRDDLDYSHPSQGAPDRLAAAVRARLDLGEGPIPSVWDLARRDLGVLVVWVELPPDIDAFALAGPDTGAVIALNVKGDHTGNAFARRVSMAHELCHVLFDRGQMRSMDRFCRIAVRRRGGKSRPHDDLHLEERIERRARAFAAALLVPRSEGIRVWNGTRDRYLTGRVRTWMTCWGIGYEAARGHLATLGRLRLNEALPRVLTEPPVVWERAEPGPPLDDLAARAGVPLNRRGDFFETVLDAVREHSISPARAREHLRLTREAWDALVGELPAPPVRRPAEEVSSAVLADWI